MQVISSNLILTRILLCMWVAVFMIALIPSTIQAQQNTIELSSKNDENLHKDIKVKLDKIKRLLSNKDYLAAELIVNQLFSHIKGLSKSPLIADIYIMAGKVYYKQKKYNDAISQYQRALSFIEGTGDISKNLLALTYHEIAQCYKHLKNSPESINYYQKAFAIHVERKDNPSIARALKNIAMAENQQKNYIKALDHARRSLTILSSDSSSSRYAQVALATGIIYRNIGDYEKSLEYILQAKKVYEQKNDFAHLAEVDNQIGLIYTDLHQLDNALSFYFQTVNLPNKEVKPETRAAAYRELGVISYHQGNYTESIHMLNAALRVYQSIANPQKTTRIFILLGRSYLKENNNAIAQDYFEKSLDLAIKLSQIEFQIQSLNYLGQLMLNQDVNQAISLLERSLVLSDSVDKIDDKMMTYHWLKEGEKKKANLGKALEYSELKYQLEQVIQQERDAVEFTKHQVILESYKLEDELNDLRENTEIDALKLEQQHNEITLIEQSEYIAQFEVNKKRFAIIILLSLFILVVLYRFYRYKKRVRN